MTDERELLQEILLRIKTIEMTIGDIQGYNKEPIHMTIERVYHEGIETGRKQVLDAMKKVGADYSHNPEQNIYASRHLAFDRLGFFEKDVDPICGNCANFDHEEYSNEGRCAVAHEVRISNCNCNVMR